MNNIHIAAALSTACLAAVGFAPVAAASTAPAAPSARTDVDTCTLRTVTTKAVNLQHDVKGTDTIRAALGNTISRSRPYTVGQRRNTLGDGEEVFSDRATISLQVEVLQGAWLTIDARNLSCETRTRDFTLSNADARYKVRAILKVLP